MSDYNFLMETRLSPEQFQVIQHLSRVASIQGLNLYLAGGAVRDLTYGQQIVRDLDFVVEGSPEKILRQLRLKPRPDAEGVPFHVAFEDYDFYFESAEVVFSNGVRAEISMARMETFEKPGKKPAVGPATIFEDLRRRDFSINAMAISLHPNSRGLLLDPTNGAGDIERRELRAMHSRSFSEDPVRIYRLLRLGLRLSFKTEERTEIWRTNSLGYGAAERLDPDQQGRELCAILREENPGRVLKALAEQKLLAGIDRKLASSRLPYDQFSKIRSVIQNVPGADPFLLNFHCLVSRLSGEQRKRLAARIFLDRREGKTALGMEAAAKKLARTLSGSKAAQPSQVFNLLEGQPQYLLLFLLAYFPQAKIQNRVKSFLFKFPTVRARIPRAELLTLGLEPGPKFDKIVHQVFLLQLDGKIRNHPQLLKEFRALAGIKEPPKPVEPKQGPKPAPPKPVKPKETKPAAQAPKPAKPARKAKKATPKKHKKKHR
ncbi:MAG: CCA tRNA nucleotidyltransferase [Acidobacteria bacterium]|nr:CCA tRNA nucleotidyltransferase [Acidobacteriota bacterium]